MLSERLLGKQILSLLYGGMEITQVVAGRLDLKEQLEIPVKKIRKEIGEGNTITFWSESHCWPVA